MAKSILRLIIGRSIGFLIFLILLAIANFLDKYIELQLYTDIVGFFNSTLLLLLSMAILGLVNEIFWHFYFPFNVLAPITSASLGVLIASFIYKFWIFVNKYINLQIDMPITTIYVIIFWIVVIVGYLAILFRGGRPKYGGSKENMQESPKSHRSQVEWQDVDEEFRLVLYNLAKSVNRKFQKNKEVKAIKKRKK